MKHTNSTHQSSIFWPLSQDAIGGAWSTLSLWASTVRKSAARCMIRLKTARMQAALSRLTDDQLKQIDLKRSNIAQHAKYLIAYEYDGL
jgi:hypothetical protein